MSNKTYNFLGNKEKRVTLCVGDNMVDQRGTEGGTGQPNVVQVHHNNDCSNGVL